MNYQSFLKNYWKIFLAHLCEFHKLDEEFIAKYEYELDWRSISKNKVLDWNLSFLQKYENRFIWHELAWNNSILWVADWIEIFKKRLDWFYLGKNTKLPVNEEFIEKYIQKICIVKNNEFLTPALKKKYKSKIIPEHTYQTQNLIIEPIENLSEILSDYTFYDNQEILYSGFIRKILDEIGLDQIFEAKFDYTQRYFEIVAVKHDVHGLTPEYCFEGKNPFYDKREGYPVFEIENELILKYGSLQEGPDRLFEVPRFSGSSLYPILLVSENVKKVLELFELPKHCFHPVKLVPKKIKTTTKYFMFHVEHDTLTKNLDYEGSSFSYRTSDFGKFGPWHEVIDKIDSVESLNRVAEEIREKTEGLLVDVLIVPSVFKIKTNHDLFSYSSDDKIIVNEFVKQKLEELLPGQMDFISVQDMNICIDQQTYDLKRKAYTDKHVELKKLDIKQSATEKYYYKKMERLEKSNEPIPAEMLENDEFYETEKRLNVCFPEKYKTFYKSKKKIWDFKMLPTSKLYVENEYSSRFPQSYKSVVVAENGCGDTLGLLLEKDSDFKLGTDLYEYFHETGEIKKHRQKL